MINSLVLLVRGRSFSQCLTIPFIALTLLVGAPSTRAQQDSSRSPGSGWGVIDLDEHKTPRAKPYPPGPDPTPPPVKATLSRLEYDLPFNSVFASGRPTLTIDVLKDGWVRVPIPAGLLVREARLDGK